MVLVERQTANLRIKTLEEVIDRCLNVLDLYGYSLLSTVECTAGAALAQRLIPHGNAVFDFKCVVKALFNAGAAADALVGIDLNGQSVKLLEAFLCLASDHALTVVVEVGAAALAAKTYGQERIGKINVPINVVVENMTYKGHESVIDSLVKMCYSFIDGSMIAKLIGFLGSRSTDMYAAYVLVVLGAVLCVSASAGLTDDAVGRASYELLNYRNRQG